MDLELDQGHQSYLGSGTDNPIHSKALLIVTSRGDSPSINLKQCWMLAVRKLGRTRSIIHGTP